MKLLIIEDEQKTGSSVSKAGRGRADGQSSTEPPDPQFVPNPEFREPEYRESRAEATRELQLVLDPDFL